MQIKKFCANNFRNIENCEIEFSPGVNILYGNNAQGKTNSIEGIYIFARGKSFRMADDKDLVRFGEEGFRISVDYESKNGKESLEYAFFGKERRRKKNGYKVDKIKEFIGNFKAVLFYPDDLTLVKNSPEERRNFINVAISQCYEIYISYYSNYKKALENRNFLLKNYSKGLYFDQNELISWSYYMAEYASYIYLMRKQYIEKLSLYTEKIMEEISEGKEKVKLFYKSDIKENIEDINEIKEKYKYIFTKEIEREKIVGSTLYGPHKDDVEIFLNEKEARYFASQGQQRSIVLAMKLSEGEVNREICGEYPVFLFDDVLSELDEKRRKFVFSNIGEKQIIITSCEKEENIDKEYKKIEVSSGVYT
jgi:DNA replication and repair protein RecF